jgi:hypothetical protein
MYKHSPFSVDSVSALDFDESGNFLAVGNRGGRILIFNRGDSVNSVVVELIF